MNDLEAKLARLPLRTPPAAWRLEILQAAQSARPVAEAAPWWHAWLRPARLVLAGTWLVIAALHFAAPEDRGTAVLPPTAGWREQVEARQAMVVRLLTPPTAPESAPDRPRGAVVWHRQNLFV